MNLTQSLWLWEEKTGKMKTSMMVAEVEGVPDSMGVPKGKGLNLLWWLWEGIQAGQV